MSNSKKSFWYSFSKLKCPKCKEGDLFPSGSFEFNKPFEMYHHCTKCNHNFLPEPGFYYGAMFISYIFMGFFCLGFTGGLVYFFDFSVNAAFFWLLVVCAIFFVPLFRYSRALWLGLNTDYSQEAGNE